MAEDMFSPRSAMQTLPMGQQIQMLQQETESARDKMKAMSKALAAVVATAEDHHQAMLQFAETITAVGGTDQFAHSRDLVVLLSQKQLNCVKKQEEHLNTMIKSFVEVRISTALGMQAKVHEAITEHEAASEKVHSLKKGSPKLADAQAHLATTQQQMDLLSFAYVNKLKQTLIDVSMVMLEKFAAFFGEATVYSMSVNTQTSSLIPELTKQQADLKKQKQSNDEERGRAMKKLATGDSPSAPAVATTTHQIKQGYIFCRGGASGGRYKQRWVSILNARLMVYKNWQAREAEATFNLVLCNVKRLPSESNSHPFVFEVRSHMDEHMQFAATDELEMTQWISVIQNVIAAQLGQNLSQQGNGSASTSSDQYQIISSVKGNDKCADCRAPEPDWISFAQGIVICIECSGVHRSFGSHISKVRSLKLDALEPELVLLMSSIGNFKANTKVFEFSMPDAQRIQPNCDRATREAFLKAKYVEKKWIPVIEDWQAHVTALMRRKKPFKPTTLLNALIQPNADINWHRPGNQKTLLHKCVAAGNLVSALLLLKLECLVDCVDNAGMTPLHLAAQVNSAPMARLLLQNGASTAALDSRRRTPRDVAIDHDSVDCIVLLDADLNGDVPSSANTGELPSPHSDSIASETRYHSSVLPRSKPTPGVTTASMPHINAANASTPSSAQKKRRPTTVVSDTNHAGASEPTSPKERFQSLSLRTAPQIPTELAVRYRDGIAEAATARDGVAGSGAVSMANLSPSSSSSSLSTDEKRSGMRRAKSAKSVAIPYLSKPGTPTPGTPLPKPLDTSSLPPPLSDDASSSTGIKVSVLPLNLPPPTSSPRDIPAGSKTRR